MAGRQIDRCQLASFSALKTVEPPLDDLVGQRVAGVERRGKFVCFDCGACGWSSTWPGAAGSSGTTRLPATTLRPGRSPIALRVGLEDGSGFDITEMGTEKRLALWVVHAPDEVGAAGRAGRRPADARVHRRAVRRHPAAGTSATLKTALTTQSLIAGVGNAYSDEALHRARLSPYKKTTTLDARRGGRPARRAGRRC